jgi:hypothetical protein
LARQYAALALGKPANDIALNSSLIYWGGFMFDEVSMTAVTFMLLARGFIPRFEYTFSKARFLDLINRHDNAIVYYSGHGAAPGTNGDAVIPGYDVNGRPEYIYPQDIHTNARIIFFNSCNSAATGSFVGALGPMNELFVGWNKSIDYIESSYFGYEWWKNMVIGSTAFDSVNAILLGIYTNNNILPDNPKVFLSNPNFRL